MRKFVAIILVVLIARAAIADPVLPLAHFGNQCPGGGALCGPIPLAPLVFYDFRSGTFPSSGVFARSTPGWYFDSAGTLTQAGINAPRFDYDPVTLAPLGLLVERSSVNLVRNASNSGASPGIPGTLPTNWSANLGPGLSQQVTVVGTENGISYVDVTIAGTAASTGSTTILYETSTGIADSNRFQPVGVSAFVKLSAGSMSGITSAKIQVTANDFGGTVLETHQSGAFTPTSASLSSQRRLIWQSSMSSSSTAFVQPSFVIAYNSGAVINATFRLGLPQVEVSFNQVVTSPIPTTGVAITRTSDAASISSPTFFSPTLGSFAVSAELNPNTSVSAGTATPISFSDGTANNRFYMSSFASNSTTCNIVSGGVAATSNGTAGQPPGYTIFRVGISYQGTNNFCSYNGGTLAGATFHNSAVPTGINRLNFDGLATGQGWIQWFKYWGYPLTQAQLNGATT